MPQNNNVLRDIKEMLICKKQYYLLPLIALLLLYAFIQKYIKN